MGNSSSEEGMPERIKSCREIIERQMKDSLENMERRKELLRGLRRLSIEERLEQVIERYEKLRRLGDFKLLGWQSENVICDYLQEQLSVTFNMRDQSVRQEELEDVIFYYLMSGEEPEDHIRKLIQILHSPAANHSHSYDWYELCCLVFNTIDSSPHSPQIRNYFTFTPYNRLNYNNTGLEYLLYKQPRLLLNEKSDHLLLGLIKRLPYDKLHEMIMHIKDKNGQTCMFYINEQAMDWSTSRIIEMYVSHIDDLYELLSISNIRGQTALHVNTYWITRILAQTYTPKLRESFLRLTSITDNNKNAALQVTPDGLESSVLSTLIKRVENNEYVINQHQSNILIIYNTNNREGAEKEAQIIRNSCTRKYGSYPIALERNKKESEILELVKQAANSSASGEGLLSSLIVILASHGNVGTIDDCDGNPIKLSTIEAAMCSETLQNRPKILITQCCQVGDASEETPTYVPRRDDFCAVMSCIAGQGSERGVFLNKLSEQIENGSGNKDIFKMVTCISREMVKEGRKQTPIIMSTLRADYCPAAWHQQSTDL